MQGIKQAADFVSIVDPWRYPGELTMSPLNVKVYIQSAVDKANEAGKLFVHFTEESKTDYLMSPLLVRAPKKPSTVPSTGKAAKAASRFYLTMPLEEAPIGSPAPEPATAQMTAEYTCYRAGTSKVLKRISAPLARPLCSSTFGFLML